MIQTHKILTKEKQQYMFLFIFLFSGFIFAQNETSNQNNLKEVLVNTTTSTITIDGKMNETDWIKSDFHTFPNVYFAEKPSDIQETEFRILWDTTAIYLFYKIKDKFITARETERDGLPFLDDCAEFFIIPAPKSANTHICFEINVNKAINDIVFVNDFYEGHSLSVKAYNPDIEVAVNVQGTINDNSDIDTGWSMEVAIPLTAFKGTDRLFPLQENTVWTFLALRQDRNDIDSERRVISTIFPIENIEKNDVHQPTMFGTLKFIK